MHARTHARTHKRAHARTYERVLQLQCVFLMLYNYMVFAFRSITVNNFSRKRFHENSGQLLLKSGVIWSVGVLVFPIRLCYYSAVVYTSADLNEFFTRDPVSEIRVDTLTGRRVDTLIVCVCACACACACEYVYMYVCICMYVCMYMYVCAGVFVYVCECARVYACACLPVFV